MYAVTIRFYEELNFFLTRDKRKTDLKSNFTGRRSVKDFIESFGVPHVEVDLILVNSEPVDFSYIVKDRDRISVYPVFERLDITGVSGLRPKPLRRPRFVLDVHLRKLAKRLRLLGFDVDYSKDRDDAELASVSQNESRILLTRDRQLLMHRIVDRGLYVRNTDPEKQINEILDRLDLRKSCTPFSRCIECNGEIYKLDIENLKPEIILSIPKGVLECCNEFFACSLCKRIYWKGSHYDRLVEIINKILG